MFNVNYLAMYKVQMHVSAISMLLYGFASVRQDTKFIKCYPRVLASGQDNLRVLIVWFCACTGDNPRAKARGISCRTDVQTIQ